MKKAILATLAAALFATTALGLAACSKGDTGEGDVPPAGDESTAPYTITFDANGGTYTGPATLETGDDGKLAALPTTNPTRENYTFDGWYTTATAGTKISVSYVFTDDTTVYAHWTAEGGGGGGQENQAPYTITLHANGGTLAGGVSSVTTGADGKLAAMPSDPTPPENQKFDGWYTSNIGGTKVDTTYTFTSNTTIYAQYVDDVQDSGTGVYVNGAIVAVLAENPAYDPAVMTKEYMAQGVMLSPGDVVTIKINNSTLTHAPGSLELWSADLHGVTFSQSAGTFTVKPGERRAFDIYAQYYVESQRMPGDSGDCWTIVMDDGSREVLEENEYYLIGSMTNWSLSADMKIGSGLTYHFTTDMEFKARQYKAGQGGSDNWVDRATQATNDSGLISWTNGGNAYVNEEGDYIITIVNGEFHLEKA
ncbi:MAG: InlB B-repeat-containing protein [Clostridiales bacterium]|nr:InlB B-repeat-containing protein [Clostridiales bacterium]